VTITLNNTTSAAAGAYLACVGPKWHEVTFSVSSAGNLQRSDSAAASTSPVDIVPGIVNIQAQYGIAATANSNTVTSWVDATGIWATPTVANRNRIKAVRIAVVARNVKREVAAVTTATCPSGAPTGLCAWVGSASSPAPTAVLSTSSVGADWAHYRYRVFETIIPLRNVIWSKGML
jgi:type IV pilus assembly protein PilW